MNDVANHVVLIAHDAYTINTVGFVADNENWTLRRFENFYAWLAEFRSLAEPGGDAKSSAGVDCVILDVPLDSTNCAKAVIEVCRARCGLPVIVVSPSPTVPGAVAAMRGGATTVIPRPFDEAELAATVSAAIDLSTNRLSQLTRVVAARNKLSQLNESEEAVLVELLDGMANKEIAHKLELGLRTVELRRSRIMKKMGAGSLAELVRMVCEANGVVVDRFHQRSENLTGRYSASGCESTA